MYLTSQECADLLHVKRATFVNQTCKQADFPKPFVISPRKRLWPKAEVHDFIRRRRQK
ncbi:TPA: helix-turn-helix transcriptional regulator [Neisseria meningitidis]